MAANMDGVGTIKMAQALQEHDLFTCLIKSYNRDIENFDTFKVNRDNYAVSTGTSDEDFRNLNTIITGIGAQFICIDVANGYSEHFGDFVEEVRNRWPHKTIIAGNVVTGDMTQELILRGADIVKVGIGPGSVCTTRIQTGVGYPQLSAIIECADAAHGLGGHIIADGGCTCPGDVAKAFGAGADFVMLGGMLAGHDEGGGEVRDDRVLFYGMSSDTAMERNHGGMAEYRSSEGRTVEIPYRGQVRNTVLNILGGLRSACTYVGAQELKHLSKCTTFVRTNRQVNEVFV
jgi:GMP reductase